MTVSTRARRSALGALCVLAGALPGQAVQAQIQAAGQATAQQRATAQQVSEHGVPLQDLAPEAPDSYTIKRGDTLWGVSGLYLRQPWRWPELWGMNLQAIRNPHLIFPGQTLYLEKDGAYARLRDSRSPDVPQTIRVVPRTRSDSLTDIALPTLKPELIEPFLVDPLVIDPQVLQQAPRVVAMADRRALMAGGDRVYARGSATAPLLAGSTGASRQYRVFRDAVALKDPRTGEVLAYEAQYLGRAELVRGESQEEVPDGKGGHTTELMPATVDLTATKSDVRAGDRLLPVPERTFSSYVPRAPQIDVDARVVSIYGNWAVEYGGQNQVVAINLGTRDGIEPGHVLSLLNKGDRVKDGTEKDQPMITLPTEVNGMAMVFRTFDRVSYALILEIRKPVRVGDQLANPRQLVRGG